MLRMLVASFCSTIMDGRQNLQQVATLAIKKAIVSWMVEDATFVGEEGLIWRIIRAFLEHFKGTSKANRTKARRWWVDQDNILGLADNANPTPIHATRSMVGRWSKTRLKAQAGRSRKRIEFINALLKDMAFYILQIS